MGWEVILEVTDFRKTVNVVSLLLVFAGTYLSLRGIMIANLETLLRDRTLNYKKWGDLRVYERIILRLFGIKKDYMTIFMISPGFHRGKQKKVVKKLYSFTEPFRAFAYFSVALALQIAVNSF